MWSAPEASAALKSRDLATILRVYRRLNLISQEWLAALLGYDKTYVSMIETRRRIISDVTVTMHRRSEWRRSVALTAGPWSSRS